jgi:hypothetical protein
LTSARDLDAPEEVVRRLREGTVMVDAEYERPYTSKYHSDGWIVLFSSRVWID